MPTHDLKNSASFNCIIFELSYPNKAYHTLVWPAEIHQTLLIVFNQITYIKICRGVKDLVEVMLD